MPTNTPTVSIAIVTWNRCEELQKAIDSCLAQTYSNIEIVLVDNASSDGTLDVIKTKYPMVKTISMHKNIGCPPARNIAMANCKGEIIYSLDDDGWLDEKCIENVINTFNKYEKTTLVASKIISSSEQFGGSDDVVETSLFTGCAFAIKKLVLEQVGYFPEYFRQGEETHLALRILDKGFKMHYNPNAVMYHAPSPKGRNGYLICYYAFKHDIDTIIYLLPFLRALPIVIYKYYSHFKSYIKNGYFHQYFLDAIIILPIIFRKHYGDKIKFETYEYFRKKRHPLLLNIE